MNNLKYLSLLLLILLSIFSSCKKTKTNAEKLQEEQNILRSYLYYQGIQVGDTLSYSLKNNAETGKYEVTTKTPKEEMWDSNSNGFKPKKYALLKNYYSYMHIVDSGTNRSSINVGDWVVVRYKRYDLHGNLVESTEYDGNPSQNKNPLTYQYISGSNYSDGKFCDAFQPVLAYLGHNGRARLIVYSPYGCDEAQREYKSYVYDIEMQVAKK